MTSPVVPRDAATIVMARDGEDGLEVFLLRRQTSMKFAAGFHVFPGGGVSPEDHEDVPWRGPGPEVWAERWRCAPDLARSLVVAAVRETFEETGVLLASAQGAEPAEVSADLQRARTDLEDHRLAFGPMLAEHGLELRADLLGAWAHWITPATLPQRFDTRFFVAALPAGQAVGAMAREADRASWVPLTRVIAAVDAGEAAMMPPTIAVCRSLAGHASGTLVSAAERRTFETVEPRTHHQGADAP